MSLNYLFSQGETRLSSIKLFVLLGKDNNRKLIIDRYIYRTMRSSICNEPSDLTCFVLRTSINTDGKLHLISSETGKIKAEDF